MLSLLPASLVALFSLTTAVAAVPSNVNPLRSLGPRATNRMCGSEPTSEEVTKMENIFTGLLAENQASNKVTPTDEGATVPVYFNVIYAIEGNDRVGDVTDDQIHKQMDVLNQAFSQTGLYFELQSITETENYDWYNNAAPCTDQQTAMKQALGKGEANALNIYTVGFNNDRARGLLGYATFPANYESNPDDDGVVLHYSTLPGGTLEPYNEGQTLTHEAGHWVGLYHTFQGGCEGEGDHVDDTPAEAEPGEGHLKDKCDVDRNTCPNDPGNDPVQNYMDYSDDACLDNFTPGQITRLKDQIATFRKIYV